LFESALAELERDQRNGTKALHDGCTMMSDARQDAEQARKAIARESVSAKKGVEREAEAAVDVHGAACIDS
jgi:hypothetical protein